MSRQITCFNHTRDTVTIRRTQSRTANLFRHGDIVFRSAAGKRWAKSAMPFISGGQALSQLLLQSLHCGKTSPSKFSTLASLRRPATKLSSIGWQLLLRCLGQCDQGLQSCRSRFRQ